MLLNLSLQEQGAHLSLHCYKKEVKLPSEEGTQLISACKIISRN